MMTYNMFLLNYLDLSGQLMSQKGREIKAESIAQAKHRKVKTETAGQ
jgi:hypothetical protein